MAKKDTQLPDLPEPYEYVDTLGSGSYGVVVLAKDATVKDPEKAKVAIKIIRAPQKMQVQAVARELMIHGAIKHPHIVPVHRCFSTEEHIGVVMEYIRGGRLFDMVNNVGPFPEAKARWIFRQLMDAVRYIHKDMNSMHRDIKLENIILADAKKQWPTIYLCDFGFARTRGPQFGPTISCVGSPNYFAPEILLRNAKNQRYDGKKADIYSCGACLFVMLFGFYPQGVVTKDRKAGKIDVDSIYIEIPKVQRQRLHPGHKEVPIGPECLNFLSQLLEPDPEKRLTLEGIWKDRWFRDNTHRRRRKVAAVLGR